MVKVAAVQMKVTPRVEENMKRILSFINKAAKKKADIVCFPETALSDDKSLLMRPYLKIIGEACKKNSIYCIFGSYTKSEHGEFNSAFLIDRRGKKVYEYKKRHLWVSEKKGLRTGNKNKAIKTDFGKIGIIICWDIAFNSSIKDLVRKGAKIIFCPTFAVEAYKDRVPWVKMPQVRAYENMVYFVFPDAKNKGAMGESYICGPVNELASIKGGREGMITADLDMKRLEKLRKYYDCWK